MGCLCSCLSKNDSTVKTSESEMVNTTSNSNSNGKIGGKEMSRKMSSPTVKFFTDENVADSTTNRSPYCTVSGSGLALACINIEQDSAYWEWHVETNEDSEEKSSGNDSENFFENRDSGNKTSLKFGVATSKNRKFYRILAANDEGDDVPMEDDGTALMRSIPNLKNGDTVGVAVQQSDLPMIQFLVNGEPMHNLAINRFRGTVYPSVWLPPEIVVDDEEEVEAEVAVGKGPYTVTVVFDESKFKELAPHARFGPLIPARGII